MTSSAPLVWALTGIRAGDETQVLGLAESLGWPFKVKRLIYHPKRSIYPNRLLGPTLSVLETGSDALEPPWPDLVIAIGRRSVPPALWIKQQSGAKTKLVQLNRPRAPLELFDLVIATPQYRMPHAANLFRIERPFHRVNRTRLREAGERWAPVFEKLPRPWIAVLAGGDAAPFRFDADTARKLGRAAIREAEAAGGSLLVTSSFRMSKAAEDALFAEIEGSPHYGFRWRREAEDNPFFGFLALADSFIVTSESVSMLSEAAETGRPIAMFPLPRNAYAPEAWLEWLYGFSIFKSLLERLDAGGWLALPRDVRAVHQALLESGTVGLLGQATQSAVAHGETSREEALRRIKALLSGGC